MVAEVLNATPLLRRYHISYRFRVRGFDFDYDVSSTSELSEGIAQPRPRHVTPTPTPTPTSTPPPTSPNPWIRMFFPLVGPGQNKRSWLGCIGFREIFTFRIQHRPPPPPPCAFAVRRRLVCVRESLLHCISGSRCERVFKVRLLRVCRHHTSSRSAGVAAA